MKNLVEPPEGIKQLTSNYLEIYNDLVKKMFKILLSYYLGFADFCNFYINLQKFENFY